MFTDKVVGGCSTHVRGLGAVVLGVPACLRRLYVVVASSKSSSKTSFRR